MINRLVSFFTRHLDPFLMTMVGVLLAIGLVVLFSASGGNLAQVAGKLGHMAAAVGVMWLVANVPPQHLARLALPVYVIGFALLVGAALFGEISHGARRWLNIGVMRFQPSEMMRLGVPLMLAWYFDRYEAILKVKDFAVGAVILALPVGLIALQPDLGTALLVASAGFYVLFLAGLSWKILVALGAAGAACLPVMWSLMHDYQRQRILTMLDPSQDPLGRGYHTIQSTIAMGSGGLFGKGWLNGTQARLDFLPERTTDFAFAVYSEEFGLFGNLVLLILFVLLIGRGLYIAANASVLFSRLLAGAVTLTFFTYAFVNMGMVSGILPVVGVPLPLISYGGTSLVMLLAGIGILMSIHTHKRLVKG